MRLRLALLSLFMAAPGGAYAALEGWRIEASGLTAVDAIVDVRDDGHLWVSVEEVTAMGIDTSKLQSTNGMIDLSVIGTVNMQQLAGLLIIQTRADLLPFTRIDMKSNSIFATPARPSGTFFNYDLRVERTQKNYIAAMLEANTFVADGIRLNAQTLANNTSQPQRLSASVSQEDAETATAWSVGDAYSQVGSRIAPVRFSGVQYGKDYRLQPGYITSPTFNATGTAAAPSTLYVLLGNQLVRSQHIPAGPFEVNNIQPLVGTSETALVMVVDALGQQQLISSSVFANPALLREGLHDFALQGGRLRPTLNTTESPFFSGYYRRGITQTLTLEINGESSKAATTLPAVQHVGTHAALATAYGNVAVGGRIGAGRNSSLSYQNAWRAQGWFASLSASMERNSPDYVQLGGGQVMPRVNSLQTSLQFQHLAFSVLASQNDSLRLNMLNMIYTSGQHDDISWSATLSQLSGASNFTTLSVSASIPLDRIVRAASERTHHSALTVSNTGQHAEYSNRAMNGMGAAYRIQGEHDAVHMRTEGNVDYRAFEADAGMAASVVTRPSGTQSGLRAYVRGALVLDDYGLLPTRSVDAGYATVDAGISNASVEVNGIPNARTNTQGKAVVSGFAPFRRTSIRLASDDLPDNYDDVTREVSTYRKAGAAVSFRGHTLAMVRIPGVSSGLLSVHGVHYQIGDNGAFVDLDEGEYVAKVQDKEVRFTIPRAVSGIAVVEAQLIPLPERDK